MAVDSSDLFSVATDWYAILLPALLALLVYYYFRSSPPLPPGPRGWPLIGYYPNLGENPHLKLARDAKKYGDVMSFYVTGRLHVHLNSLDAIKEAFITSGDVFNARTREFDLFNWVDNGMGIFQTDGPEWKEQRRFFVQSMKEFGFGKISLEEHIHETIRIFLTELKKMKGESQDIIFPLSNATSNIICKMLFNKQFSAENKEFSVLSDNMMKMFESFFGGRVYLIGPLFQYVIFKLFPSFRKMEEYKINIHRTMDKIIADHRKSFDKNNCRDYVDVYLSEIQKLRESGQLHKTSFSDDRMRAILVSMFVEGTQSVSTALYFLIRSLSQYGDVQKKMQAEIDEVVGRERLPSWLDRTQMPFTEATILELHRIAVAFPLGAPHCCAEDTILRGYRIPKRTIIIPNLYSVHRDPKIFLDPHKFDPTRFLTSSGKRSKTELPIPFGIGKRSCVGESLASMEIFLIMTSLMQNFTLKPDGKYETHSTDIDRNFGYKLRAIPREVA